MHTNRSILLLFAAMASCSACTGSIGRGEGSRGHDGPDAGEVPGPEPIDSGGIAADAGGGAKPPPIDSLTGVYPASVLCPPPPVSSPGLSAGFESTCAGCHGPTGDGHAAANGHAAIPSLKNVPTVEQFIAIVRTG